MFVHSRTLSFKHRKIIKRIWRRPYRMSPRWISASVLLHLVPSVQAIIEMRALPSPTDDYWHTSESCCCAEFGWGGDGLLLCHYAFWVEYLSSLSPSPQPPCHPLILSNHKFYKSVSRLETLDYWACDGSEEETWVYGFKIMKSSYWQMIVWHKVMHYSPSLLNCIVITKHNFFGLCLLFWITLMPNM